MKHIMWAIVTVVMCGCTYNYNSVYGNNNKIDGAINAPKEIKTDVSGSGYGDVTR